MACRIGPNPWTALPLLMLCGCALAATAPASTEPETPMVTAPLEGIDTAHHKVSEAVETTARRLDRFFGDERAFEEENDSSVQISLDMVADEHDAIEFGSKVKAKIRLPSSERRLQLVIESDPRELDNERPEDDPIDALDRSSDFIVGLEQEIPAGDWQLRPSVGLRFDWPIDPYARVRAIRYFDLDTWVARVSGAASWFESEGSSLGSTVDFVRRIRSDMLFRSSSSVLWEEQPSLTSAGQMFTVYQRLASHANMAYDLGANFDNESDWQASNYFARLRWRRLFYQDWAYVELQPMIAWPEENGFEHDLSLLVRLEVNFGPHADSLR